MVKYKVFIKPSAAKELERIPREYRLKIIYKIHSLSDSPRPTGCKKLTTGNSYRLRYRDYRIIYLINDEKFSLTIIKIGHRKQVYRKN